MKWFKCLFLKIRVKIIILLAGRDMPVILNSKVYDDIISYNLRNYKDVLIHNCQVENFESHLIREVKLNESCGRKGVERTGNAFVLTGF